MKWSLATLLVLTTAALRADDWPTFQHDFARSGATAAKVQTPLAEQWVYRSAVPPKPAWPLPQAGWTELPKVDFDDAFYTVADRDTVYFGSSVDHQVHALDAATGTPRWEFFTGGPVRLAPTLANDRVYFGSDDGKVYALDRAKGSLAWSRDLAPDPRRVIGNGSITSLWPIRTGVIVADGKLYCGSGVFPYHRVALHALDAATGNPIWKQEELTTTGGFSPQGYPLLLGHRLIVPAGRGSPLFVKRETGEGLFSVAPVTEKGGATGTYGTIVDETLFVGTQNTLYGVNTDTGASRGKLINADRLVASPQSYFILKGPPAPRYGRSSPSTDGNDITCIDRAAWAAQPKKDDAGLKASRKWRFAKPGLASLILAGPHVIAGGAGEVYVLDAATGQQVWSAKVDGLAVGLTVAHGRLLVSTTKGAIHCFAPGEAKIQPVAASAMLDREGSLLARLVARLAGGRKGFALIVSEENVLLAKELAKVTEFKIICAVPEGKVSELRRDVAAAGLYGHRITVEAGSKDALPLPVYAANLVVILGELPSSKELKRVLKPCGGVLLNSTIPADLTDIGVVADLGRSGHKLTRGELPGSGWWTHQFADSGGSGSSGDERIKGKLDVLWFGEPGADRFPDRHERGTAPLVHNGRVYCEGWNFLSKKTTVFCFDEYNGTLYWERDVEGHVRIGLPAVSGNFVLGGGRVFIAMDSKCHELDGNSGEIKATHETPAKPDGEHPDWGYLAYADGMIIGSTTFESRARFSDVLFAIDAKTGKQAWMVKGREIRDTTIAVASGKIFYADNTKDPPTRPTPVVSPNAKGPVIRSVVALDLATGKKQWEQEVDLVDCGRWEHASFGTVHALCKDDVLVFGGAYTIYYNPKAKEEIPRRAAVALSAKDGKPLWNGIIANKSRPVIMHDALLGEPLFYDLKTGEKVLKKVGTKMVPWSMGPRTGGCGSLSACESMVFGRGGWTVWKDVDTGGGTAFIGTRPGCFINIIPAGGVVVQAEASSGCTCYQAIQCTVVLKPRVSQ